jgi:hypothetical protein
MRKSIRIDASLCPGLCFRRNSLNILVAPTFTLNQIIPWTVRGKWMHMWLMFLFVFKSVFADKYNVHFSILLNMLCRNVTDGKYFK